VKVDDTREGGKIYINPLQFKLDANVKLSGEYSEDPRGQHDPVSRVIYTDQRVYFSGKTLTR